MKRGKKLPREFKFRYCNKSERRRTTVEVIKVLDGMSKEWAGCPGINTECAPRTRNRDLTDTAGASEDGWVRRRDKRGRVLSYGRRSSRSLLRSDSNAMAQIKNRK